MKRYKLSNAHMLTQKITLACQSKDIFESDVKKRIEEEIKVPRTTYLQTLPNKTITKDTLSPDKIGRLN